MHRHGYTGRKLRLEPVLAALIRGQVTSLVLHEAIPQQRLRPKKLLHTLNV